MRIAIVGSRDYQDLESVRLLVQLLHEQDPKTIIVSGGARGVDKTAELEARRLKMTLEIYEADWNKHGKKAGILRNSLIIAAADLIYAFHDGKSPGTKHSMEQAKKRKKPLEVNWKPGFAKCPDTLRNPQLLLADIQSVLEQP